MRVKQCIRKDVPTCVNVAHTAEKNPALIKCISG